jgi:RNA polymerase sigma-70 factor (sigma-E family)
MSTEIGPVEGAERAQLGRIVWVDEGFPAFVRDRSAALARTALLLTADRHLAEDLVQSALAKVADRWTRLASTGDPTPYVRKVMLRTAISWRRRRWAGEVPVATIPDVADAAANVRDADECLRRALGGLPPRQRAVLVLRFYEDLTEADTAAALGCSVGTVKSQTAKGLVRLRAALATKPS